MRLALIPILMASLVACETDGLNADWYHWDVNVVGVADDCHETPVPYADAFTYSLEFVGGGSETVLRIGEDPFATGTFAGCKLSYDSGVVLARHSDHLLKKTNKGDIYENTSQSDSLHTLRHCFLPNGTHMTRCETDVLRQICVSEALTRITF